MCRWKRIQQQHRWNIWMVRIKIALCLQWHRTGTCCCMTDRHNTTLTVPEWVDCRASACVCVLTCVMCRCCQAVCCICTVRSWWNWVVARFKWVFSRNKQWKPCVLLFVLFVCVDYYTAERCCTSISNIVGDRCVGKDLCSPSKQRRVSAKTKK